MKNDNKRGENIKPNIIILLVLIKALTIPTSMSQSWSEKTISVPDQYQTSTIYDYFGRSVAVDGDYLVVGADRAAGENGISSGAAEVFHYNGTEWISQAILWPSDGNNIDDFGVSVAIHGDVITVGASSKDQGSGAVYVFTKPTEGWEAMTETAILRTSDATEYENGLFGYDVAIDEDVIVVGTRFHDAAYIFEKPADGWGTMTETAKLIASDGAINDYFGHSVNIDENTIVVGAYGKDNGAVYVFEKPDEGWGNTTENAILSASDGASNDYLGFSVAISSGIIVAGAYADDNLGNSSGSAYVFEQPAGGWVDMHESAILNASDGAEGDDFGYSADIHEDVILIGAPDKENGKGAIYIYEKPIGGWENATETNKLEAGDASDHDDFGYRVSVGESSVVAGSPFNDDLGISSGSSYAFYKTDAASSWATVDAENETKLTYDTPVLFTSDGAQYGIDVAMDEDYAVIGANHESNESGAAYVLQRIDNEWHKVARLTASDAAEGDHFGFSVAIAEDEIVVGTYDANNKSGVAYIFEKPTGGWIDMTETARIIASDGEVDDYFGYSVSIDNHVVVVGAYKKATSNGTVYVYEKPVSGWTNSTETVKIPNPDVSDYFGYNVAIEEEVIVIGAFGENGDGTAYVFENTTGDWGTVSQTAQLSSSDIDDLDAFGSKVAIDNDLIAVGAYGDAGYMAYLFEKNTSGWEDMTEVATLTTNEKRSDDFYGMDISIDQDMILMGANFEDDYYGAAFLYKQPESGWEDMTETQKLSTSDGITDTYFGNSVAINNGWAAIGAYWGIGSGFLSGSVFFYSKKIEPTIDLNLSNKTYGDLPFELMATSNSPNSIYYESSDPSIISIADDGETATINSSGTVTIIASQEEDIDYLAGRTEQTISVNKAPLTITADNKEMLQGDAVPVLTMSIDGFVYDDSEASIEIPTVSTSATGEEAGSFDIVLTGGSADNYELTLINGLLTVTETGNDNGDDDDSDDNGDDDGDDDSDDNDGNDGDGSDDGDDDDNNDDILSTQTPNEQYSIYPNPTTSQLTINTDNPIKTIQVLDLNGKVLVQEEGSNTIDVSALRSGVYMLRITTSNGHYSTYKVYKK